MSIFALSGCGMSARSYKNPTQAQIAYEFSVVNVVLPPIKAATLLRYTPNLTSDTVDLTMTGNAATFAPVLAAFKAKAKDKTRFGFGDVIIDSDADDEHPWLFSYEHLKSKSGPDKLELHLWQPFN